MPKKSWGCWNQDISFNRIWQVFIQPIFVVDGGCVPYDYCSIKDSSWNSNRLITISTKTSPYTGKDYPWFVISQSFWNLPGTENCQPIQGLMIYIFVHLHLCCILFYSGNIKT